ncbi:hypothetical protein SK128_012258 [Halocaridina rubra]|uniref:LIM zinc-binding domain-containing protein n=1 Tax=Halocaridina rubra TaxID=373956 RepID=A0AAN8WIK4_HALRR
MLSCSEKTARTPDGQENSEREKDNRKNSKKNNNSNYRKKYSRVKVSEELLFQLRNCGSEEEILGGGAGGSDSWTPEGGDKDIGDNLNIKASLKFGLSCQGNERTAVQEELQGREGGRRDSGLPEGGDKDNIGFLDTKDEKRHLKTASSDGTEGKEAVGHLPPEVGRWNDIPNVEGNGRAQGRISPNSSSVSNPENEFKSIDRTYSHPDPWSMESSFDIEKRSCLSSESLEWDFDDTVTNKDVGESPSSSTSSSSSPTSSSSSISSPSCLPSSSNSDIVISGDSAYDDDISTPSSSSSSSSFSDSGVTQGTSQSLSGREYEIMNLKHSVDMNTEQKYDTTLNSENENDKLKLRLENENPFGSDNEQEYECEHDHADKHEKELPGERDSEFESEKKDIVHVEDSHENDLSRSQHSSLSSDDLNMTQSDNMNELIDECFLWLDHNDNGDYDTVHDDDNVNNENTFNSLEHIAENGDYSESDGNRDNYTINTDSDNDHDKPIYLKADSETTEEYNTISNIHDEDSDKKHGSKRLTIKNSEELGDDIFVDYENNTKLDAINDSNDNYMGKYIPNDCQSTLNDSLELYALEGSDKYNKHLENKRGNIGNLDNYVKEDGASENNKDLESKSGNRRNMDSYEKEGSDEKNKDLENKCGITQEESRDENKELDNKCGNKEYIDNFQIEEDAIMLGTEARNADKVAKSPVSDTINLNPFIDFAEAAEIIRENNLTKTTDICYTTDHKLETNTTEEFKNRKSSENNLSESSKNGHSTDLIQIYNKKAKYQNINAGEFDTDNTESILNLTNDNNTSELSNENISDFSLESVVSENSNEDHSSDDSLGDEYRSLVGDNETSETVSESEASEAETCILKYSVDSIHDSLDSIESYDNSLENSHSETGVQKDCLLSSLIELKPSDFLSNVFTAIALRDSDVSGHETSWYLKESRGSLSQEGDDSSDSDSHDDDDDDGSISACGEECVDSSSKDSEGSVSASDDSFEMSFPGHETIGTADQSNAGVYGCSNAGNEECITTNNNENKNEIRSNERPSFVFINASDTSEYGSNLESSVKIIDIKRKKHNILPTVHASPKMKIIEEVEREEKLSGFEDSNNKTEADIQNRCHSCSSKNSDKSSRDHHSGSCLGCLVEKDKNDKKQINQKDTRHGKNDPFQHQRKRDKKDEILIKEHLEDVNNENNIEAEQQDYFNENESWLDSENRRWYKVGNRPTNDEKTGLNKPCHGSNWGNSAKGTAGHEGTEWPNDLEDLRWRKIRARLTGSSRRRMRRVNCGAVSHLTGNEDLSNYEEPPAGNGLGRQESWFQENKNTYNNSYDLAPTHKSDLSVNKVLLHDMSDDGEDTFPCENVQSAVGNMCSFSAFEFHNSRLAAEYYSHWKCPELGNVCCENEDVCCQHRQTQNGNNTRQLCCTNRQTTCKHSNIERNDGLNHHPGNCVDDYGYNSDFEGEVDSDDNSEEEESDCDHDDDCENDIHLADKTLDSLSLISVCRGKQEGRENKESKNTEEKIPKRKRDETIVMVCPVNDVLREETGTKSDSRHDQYEHNYDYWSPPLLPSYYRPVPITPLSPHNHHYPHPPTSHNPLYANPPVNSHPTHHDTHVNSSESVFTPIFPYYEVYNHALCYGLPEDIHYSNGVCDAVHSLCNGTRINSFKDPNSTHSQPSSPVKCSAAVNSSNCHAYLKNVDEISHRHHTEFDFGSQSGTDRDITIFNHAYIPPASQTSKYLFQEQNEASSNPSTKQSAFLTHYDNRLNKSSLNSHIKESEYFNSRHQDYQDLYVNIDKFRNVHDVGWQDPSVETNCGNNVGKSNICKSVYSHHSSSSEGDRGPYGASSSQITSGDAGRPLDDSIWNVYPYPRSLSTLKYSEGDNQAKNVDISNGNEMALQNSFSFCEKPLRLVSKRDFSKKFDARPVVSTNSVIDEEDLSRSLHRPQHRDGECNNEFNGKNSGYYEIVGDRLLENKSNAWMTPTDNQRWSLVRDRYSGQNCRDSQSIAWQNSAGSLITNGASNEGKIYEEGEERFLGKVMDISSSYHFAVGSPAKMDSSCALWSESSNSREVAENMADTHDTHKRSFEEQKQSVSDNCSCLNETEQNFASMNDRISKEMFWKVVKYDNVPSRSSGRHGRCPGHAPKARSNDLGEEKENTGEIRESKEKQDVGKISSTSQKWLKSIPASCLSHTLCAQYPLYKKIQNALCRTDNIIASAVNQMKSQTPVVDQPKSNNYIDTETRTHLSKEPIICSQPKSILKDKTIFSEDRRYQYLDTVSSRNIDLSRGQETSAIDYDCTGNTDLPEDFWYIRSLQREPPDGTASPDEPLEKKSKAYQESFDPNCENDNCVASLSASESSELDQEECHTAVQTKYHSQEVWDPGKDPLSIAEFAGEVSSGYLNSRELPPHYDTPIESDFEESSLAASQEVEQHTSELSAAEQELQYQRDRADCGLPLVKELHPGQNAKSYKKPQEEEREEEEHVTGDYILDSNLPISPSEWGETNLPNHTEDTELPLRNPEIIEPRPSPLPEAFKPTKTIIPEPTTHQSSIFLAVDPLTTPNQRSLIDLMKLGHYEGYVTMPMMFKPAQLPSESVNEDQSASQEISSPEIVDNYDNNSSNSSDVMHSTQVRVSLRKYCKKKRDGSRKLVIKFTLCLECAGCKEELVEGQALIALDQQWHIWCFKCAACNTVLHGEYMGKDGLPYCEKDYQAQFGVKCAYCNRFISGKVLQAGDNHHFHPTCARCTKCGDPFGDGEEMYLQGTAIWHPRCGPGPTENGTVLNGSISNGHHVNGDQKVERERDFDGMSSTASETQFSRSRTPSLNGSFRSYSPYNSLNRKFSGPYRTCSPGLILREYKSSQSPVDITRIYTYSYLTAEPSQGYLKRPLDPYDRPPPKSPHFHRPPPDCRKLSLPKTNSRLGMRVLVDQMHSETPRPKSPHMNNEEPIALSHYPGGRKPPTGGISRIERDDFPAPPYPYTDPDVSERRRRWSGSTKAVSIDETDEATELEDDDTLVVEDPKLKKEEAELSKIATGIGKVFLQQVKEREKIRAWKATHLDPRNASRSPAADREPGNKLRFGTSLNAYHSRPWGPEDDEFDRGSSYRCSTGRSSATIPSYNVVSALRGDPKPGYGLKSSTLPAAGRNGGPAGLIGDYSFTGLGEKTQSTEFSSARSDERRALCVNNI